MSHTTTASAAPRGFFPATRWSIVLAARGTTTVASAEALEELCRAYWRPIYLYIRRRGNPAHDAEDLTQGFFANILERDSLAYVGAEKGRLRSFFLTAVNCYLANQHERAGAQRRGGGKIHIAIDPQGAEDHCPVDPADPTTPEDLFERQWAMTLLEHVLAGLHAEYVRDGKGALFAELKGCLSVETTTDAYAAISQRLELSEGAIKTAVHRLRQRYRQRLRDHIAETVATPDEVDDEIKSLFRAFARTR